MKFLITLPRPVLGSAFDPNGGVRAGRGFANFDDAIEKGEGNGKGLSAAYRCHGILSLFRSKCSQCTLHGNVFSGNSV